MAEGQKADSFSRIQHGRLPPLPTEKRLVKVSEVTMAVALMQAGLLWLLDEPDG